MELGQDYRLLNYTPGIAPVGPYTAPATQAVPQAAIQPVYEPAAPAPAMPVDTWEAELPVPEPKPEPKPEKDFAPRRGRNLEATFERLDRDDNGKLEDQEIARVETFAGVRYDRDRNGAVNKQEFTAAREKDEAALERKRREGSFDRLSRKDRARLKKTRDANRDGKLTFSEFEQGAQKAVRQQLHKRRSTLFSIADKNRDGVLRGKELRGVQAYDGNKNRMISKDEFLAGQRADLERAEDALRLEGKLSKPVAKRLRQNMKGEDQKLPVYGLRVDAAKVAALLGSPVDAVRRNLPGIQAALEKAGIKDRNSFIAALATIRTEVGSFQPINEYGGPGYWSQYNGRSDLGNRPGTNDGVRYHGRGYIQLTGRANYINYGQRIGENLVGNPNRALNPKVAAKVLMEYFKGRGIPGMARSGDWHGVRRAVNGGYNGLDTFLGAVNRLRSSKGWFELGWHKK